MLGLVWEKQVDNQPKITGGDNIKQFKPKIIK